MFLRDVATSFTSPGQVRVVMNAQDSYVSVLVVFGVLLFSNLPAQFQFWQVFSKWVYRVNQILIFGLFSDISNLLDAAALADDATSSHSSSTPTAAKLPATSSLASNLMQATPRYYPKNNFGDYNSGGSDLSFSFSQQVPTSSFLPIASHFSSAAPGTFTVPVQNCPATLDSSPCQPKCSAQPVKSSHPASFIQLLAPVPITASAHFVPSCVTSSPSSIAVFCLVTIGLRLIRLLVLPILFLSPRIHLYPLWHIGISNSFTSKSFVSPNWSFFSCIPGCACSGCCYCCLTGTINHLGLIFTCHSQSFLFSLQTSFLVEMKRSSLLTNCTLLVRNTLFSWN